MTPERAQAAIAQARERAVYGPWSDQLDAVLSKVERAEVCRVWDTMPGYTTFVDALEAIAQGYDPDRVDVVIPDDVACSGVCDG